MGIEWITSEREVEALAQRILSPRPRPLVLLSTAPGTDSVRPSSCAASSPPAAAVDAAGGNAEPRVLDLDIGVVALEGLEALGRADYTFRWHPGQSSLNRAPVLYGVTVADPVG